MSVEPITGLKNPDYRRGFAPQLLHLIVFPLLRGEDMDNNITEIEEHPARVNAPFTAIRGNPLPAQCLVYFIANSLNLAFAIAATENEVIGKSAQLPQVQHENISSLLA